MKASEVRSQWKETLDKAVAGETILFDRTGIIFELKAIPYKNTVRVTEIKKPKKIGWVNNQEFRTINPKPQVITKIDPAKFDSAEPITLPKMKLYNVEPQLCKKHKRAVTPRRDTCTLKDCR